MDRINAVLHHPLYQELILKNELAEADRRFCHHNIDHFLAVARIAMLINLQESLQIEKDFIYSAAILHDIGRVVEYEEGTPHDIVSAKLAEKILPDCGFDNRETKIIAEAIAGHRNRKKNIDEKEKKTALEELQNKEIPASLGSLLYKADKLSRNCLFCPVKSECNWTEEAKNKAVTW